MTSRLFPPALLISICFSLLPGCNTANHQERKRPNIIFIFTDDHAPHALGAYGGPLAALNPTPNMDRLAREGMLFRNAFVTNSICAPSRAVILTGLHSHLNSVPTNREVFDSTLVTFPKLLQQAGYQTAMIGKWHLKSEPTGFDHWEVLPGQGHYYNPDFRTPNGMVRDSGYVTDLITDKVLNWLEEGRNDEQPFMVMYQHKAPHRRWSPGTDHLNTFDDVEIPEPSTLFDDYSGRTSATRTQEMEIGRHMDYNWDLKVRNQPDPNRMGLYNRAEELHRRMDLSQQAAWDSAYEPKNKQLLDANLTGDDLIRWKYQRYIKDYLRVIRSVDDNLGRLLAYLEESGLDENTVVIYNSDQGFYLGDHGWFDKRWMYEESMRTPLIVRWPGVVQPGSANTDLVQNLDLAQTFLGIAGVEAPDEMQGLSLLPLLKSESPGEWRDALYYQYYEYPGPHMVRRHYGVRTERYKLIYYYEIDEWELFDLETDPDELKSVYENPSYEEIKSQLLSRLTELRTQYRVPEDDATLL